MKTLLAWTASLAVFIIVSFWIAGWITEARLDDCIARGGVATTGHYDKVCVDADGRVLP